MKSFVILSYITTYFTHWIKDIYQNIFEKLGQGVSKASVYFSINLKSV